MDTYISRKLLGLLSSFRLQKKFPSTMNSETPKRTRIVKNAYRNMFRTIEKNSSEFNLKKPCCKTTRFKVTCILLILLLSFIAIGTIVYHTFHQWTWSESFTYTIVTAFGKTVICFFVTDYINCAFKSFNL